MEIPWRGPCPWKRSTGTVCRLSLSKWQNIQALLQWQNIQGHVQGDMVEKWGHRLTARTTSLAALPECATWGVGNDSICCVMQSSFLFRLWLFFVYFYTKNSLWLLILNNIHLTVVRWSWSQARTSSYCRTVNRNGTGTGIGKKKNNSGLFSRPAGITSPFIPCPIPK